MTARWLHPAHLFDGQNLHADMAVAVSDGFVTDMQPRQSLQSERMARFEGLITPGFVDLQVNGGADVLVNNRPDVTSIRSIAAAHRALGTMAIMPTVITDRPEILAQAADAVKTLRDDTSILGLHIEGPHIDPVKRGTHAADHIRPLDEQTMRVVADLRQADVPTMVTLAPEAAHMDQIRTLADLGVIVSLGHSNCTAATARAAFAAGASCVTHLFNAMSGLSARAPGLAGAAINSDAYVSMICDGVHVEDTVLGIAVRGRPRQDRCFLVSDAMPTVGGTDSFDLYGQTIRLSGDRLINADGNLAGAHTTMAAGFSRLVTKIGLGLETALRMVVSTPAKVVGVPERASLVGRRVDAILVLSPDLNVTGTLEKVT